MILPPPCRPGGLEKKVALKTNIRMALLAHGINQGCNTFFLT